MNGYHDSTAADFYKTKKSNREKLLRYRNNKGCMKVSVRDKKLISVQETKSKFEVKPN